MSKSTTKPKRILLMHRYYWPDKSSCSSIIKHLCSHFSSEGHKLDVITSQPSYRQDPKNNMRPKIETIDGVKITRLTLPSETGTFFLRIINSFKLSILLLKKAMFDKYDIILVTSIPPILGGFFGAISSKLTGTDLIYFCMDIHPEMGILSRDNSNPFLYRILSKIDIWSCSQARIILVHSEDMKRSLLKRKNKKKLNIDIINNFSISFQKIKYSSQFSKNNLTLVYAGNLGRFQSLEKIIDVMALIKKYKNIKLIMIGDGTERNNLIEKAKKVKANISFIDHLSEEGAQNLIRKADLGLVPLMENVFKYAYPSKTMSYLEQGKPILAIIEKNSQLSLEIMKFGYGFSIEQNDTKKLTNLLIKLSKDHSWKKPMNIRALKAFQKKFSSNIVLKQWSDTIKRIS